MNVLILHGIMGHAGENWGQWLNDQLLPRGYTVTMPTLPDADRPDRQTWLAAITETMQNLGEETIIIAHSLGVTSALDYLEQPGHTVKGLISVSGFTEDYGLDLNSYFLQEKSIDFTMANENIGKAFVFFGNNDPYVPQESLQQLADRLEVEPIIIAGGGHLNTAAGYSQFPQLLEAVLSI